MLLLNAAALAAAVVFALAAGARRRTSQLCLATLGGYLVIVHTAVLLAGLVGSLTVTGLAVVVTAALVVGIGLLWTRRGRLAQLAAPAPRELPGARAPFNAVALFPPLAATAALVLWLWPHLLEATRLWPWDDYTYHMVYPALWLGERAIAAPAPVHAFTTQAWYPLSASVVATWFMAPHAGARADALAWVSLTGPLYAGLFVAGVAELYARLRCRPGAWAVPVILFATSARIGVMASSFSDADLAHATALFAALVFAVPRGGTERRTAVVADAWYAALLTGLALGVKVSAAPAAMIVLALVLLRTRGGTAAAGPWRRDAGVTASIFAVAWIATAGYWYARNLLHTGNPVYPAAFLVWPGATFPETTLREYASHYGLHRALGDALHVYLMWPVTHALLALAGVAALAGGLVFRRAALTRPARYFAGGALTLAIGILILLPSTPYSAGNAMTFRSGFIHWDSMRYVALVPLLGWAALGLVIDGGAGAPISRNLVAAVVSAGALLVLPHEWVTTLLALLGLMVAAVLLAAIGRRLAASGGRPGQGPLLATSVGALALGGLVAVSHGAKSAATAAAIHGDPLFGAAARVLDAQPAGTRVAVFGDQWIYPAFGARHHLAPVRVDRDGRVATRPIGNAMEPGEPTVDAATLRANLRAAAVGLVVVLRQPHPARGDERPGQEGALQGQGGVRLLHRDRATAIFALDP
jgi:hypothetical protein